LDKPWIKYITIDNLPNEDMKIIASVIGLEATIKIMSEFSGVTFAVPKKAMLAAKIKYIKEVYDGSKTSRSLLAKQCDMSENYILKLYKKHHF
jgi:Mor family transcriptional regulator